jgi:hypothetical protein
MDTNKKDQNGNWIIPIEMCDGISPFSVDLTRAADYWSQGKLDDWTASANGTTVTFTWKDHAWAEGSQSVHYYQWGWNGSAWVWIDIGNQAVTTNTGLHKETEDRTFSTYIIGSPGVYYRACGWAWFYQYWTFGPGVCSSYVQVP